MADNAVVNPGVGGITVATDDIGGIHFPRTKMCWGADGSANDTSVANPMPVVQTGALPAGANNIGTVELSATALSALETITVAALTAALPAGDNNIGNVDIVTLPALPAGTNNIGDVDVLTIAAGVIVEVQGDVAHDAAIAGNPVTVGMEARATDRAVVVTGDAVRAIADTLGKQIVLPGSAHAQNVSGRITKADNVVVDVIAAQGASVRTVVTSILVINGHATVGTKVEILDGATIKMTPFCAPAGGGFSLNAGGTPLFISTANTAVRARCATTGSDVDVFVSGYTITN